MSVGPVRRLARISALLALTPAWMAGNNFNIPSTLTLQAAKSLLLKNNPQLQAARLQTEVEGGDVIAADKYLNPQIEIGTEGLGSGATGSFLNNQELSITLRQELLTGGKRKKRTTIELTDVEIAAADTQNVERLLLFDLKQAYFRVVLAQEDMRLAGEILDRFKDVVSLNRRRYELGEISGGELRRVEAAEYQFYEDLVRSEVDLRNAKDQVLELFGGVDFSIDFAVVDTLEADFSAPPLDELRTIALRQRPDLVAQRARIHRAELSAELERALAKPNPEIFAGYRRDFGQTGAIVGVNWPLFVFNRNQGPISRSLAEGRREESRLRWLEAQTLREVQTSVNELDGNRRRIQALRKDYLRIAMQSRDITDSAYRLGAASLIELLESERTYRETQRAYLRSLFDFRISRARLEVAVGEEL